MNRILFSLVSYFCCLLFFVSSSEAATFVVNNPAADNSAGTLAWAVGQVNSAGVGPHTISIQSNTTFWGSPVTLSANDVTITGNVTGCANPTYVVDWAAASIIIAGNNCVIKGLIFRSASLILQGSNNRVWGCWFNMNAAGTAGQGGSINNSSAVQVDGGSNNTIGLGGQCRNVFSGVSMSQMVRVSGAANNTIISNNYMGVAVDGVTQIGSNLSTQSAVYFDTGTQTGCRVDSNIIATSGNGILIASSSSTLNIRSNDISNVLQNGIKVESTGTLNTLVITNNKIRSVTTVADRTDEGDGFGIKLRSFTSNSVTVQHNLVGVQANGIVGGTDLGCSKNGIYARANIAALLLDDNVVCDNGNAQSGREVCSGIFITANGETFGSITVTNNYVGVDKSGNKKGNDFAGINLRYVAGGMSSVNISTNYVGDNGANAGPNPQNPNYMRRSHGIALQGFHASSPANFKVDGNFVGAFPSGGSYLDVGNHANGIELYDCQNFIVGEPGAGNVVGFNKFETIEAGFTGAGIMINGASSNGTLQANLIGVGSAGQNIGNINPTNANGTLANTNSGITIEQSTNITIGGSAANQANTIKNNNIGIQIAKVGATNSSSNTITGNTVSNNTTSGILVSGGNSNTFTKNTIASNGTYGIYIPSGTGNTIGDVTNAANGNTITGSGSDGIRVTNTISANNKISRNSIYCNSGQAIELNYGPTPGNTGLPSGVITQYPTTNSVKGTSVPNATIEVFTDNPGCHVACGSSGVGIRRESQTYLGTTTADASGDWTYTHGSVLDTANISATVTLGQNTAEITLCDVLTLCPSNADAGPNQNLCNVTSTTLAANNVTAAGGTGTWTVVSGTGNVTSLNSPTSTVTGLVPGTLVLKWTVTKTGCSTTESSVTIVVSAPSQSNAGTTQNLCNVTIANLNATTTVGTGAWTANQAGRAVTTPSSPTSGVTGLQVGANTFTWTVTNGVCAAATSTVTINVSAPSQSNAGTTQNLCNVTTANLNATTTVGTGAWTGPSGVGITTPSSPTSGVTSLAVGANTFTWTVTNGACVAATSTVTINVSAPSQSNAGTTQNLCNVT
ncbi:MAG: hypothetical protein JWM14_2803, partial [Chitinophagaceae bacterium]|nr:hypothetical protein [Chitinophagaceae bacterium]